MDPGLLELIAAGAPGDEVAVIVRLVPGTGPPPGLRLISRFGDVATGRAERGALAAIHGNPAVASLKAPRVYAGEIADPFGRPAPLEPGVSEADPTPIDTDIRRPPGLPETGRGTVVAVIDWSIDFAHPDFRDAAGRTRLVCLWDQRAPDGANPYGYGQIHSRQDIDRALTQADPFAALGYQPTGSPSPAHGTHVLGIAAGNGRAGGPQGIAPEADLIFVHLGPGLGDLGNSVDLLEAIDMVVKAAGERPLAINMSIGRHAGPHDGTLLIERAIDWLIVNRQGTVVVQSAGNYYGRDVHMQGRMREARTTRLPFTVPRADTHPVTVELWYKGIDCCDARAIAPDGSVIAAALGTSGVLADARGRELGRFYHRARDPNNGDNLIALVLRPMAPAGRWGIEITGTDVADGRWHAWIERNAGCPPCQAKFEGPGVSRGTTTGSICNALRTIAVGAYDGHHPERPLGRFSSVGPTRDGRRKPLLSAPGVRVLSVRSRQSALDPPGYVRMSGTSMAAPHVTGAAALILEVVGRQPVSVIRQLLFATLDRVTPRTPSEPESRWGYGVLNIASALAAARALRAGHRLLPTYGDAADCADETFENLDLQELAAMEHKQDGTDFSEATIAGPPVSDAERRWTKGRKHTLKSPEEIVLSQFSDGELREMLGQPPRPPVAVASRESEAVPPPAGTQAAPDPANDPAPAPPAEPPVDDPLPADPPAAEPSPPAAGQAPSLPPAGPGALPDPKALVNVAVNPQIPSTQVVGWPGARLAVPLIAGDIILRGDHGRRRRATMIARSRLVPRKDVRGRRVQARESGFYVETISEAGIERILGPEGLLLPDVMIVRSRDDSGSGESDPPVTPRPMVRSGSRGLVVREAQERLNVAHYRNIDQGGIGLARCPLTTDGVFGANTRAAVRAFQRHVFPDDPRAWDGILGPKTWATLIAASGLPKVSAPPVIDDPQPATFSESPESPAPLYLRQGDNPGDPLDRYRIRGSLYSKEYQMWAAFDPSGLIRTSSAIGPEESRLAMDGPPGLAIGKELMRFENGRLGEFVLKFNEFTLYFDEVLRSIGRLRDLLSAGAPEAPTDLTLLQKRSLRPTDDFQPSRSRKQAYSDWRLRQRAYAALRSTGREHELARHAYWRAHGQLLRTLATQIDKPTFESIALSLGDIASAVTGGWAGVLVVLGDKLIETHKNRAEYNEAMKRFQELLKKTKAQVRDELEAMTEAGTVYWDNLEKYRKAIQAREEARASTREAAASLGQELLSPAERRGQMASEIRMPPMVSDAWRALALAGPTAFVKLSAVLKAGPLIERAVFHFAKPDPTRTSDIAAVIKAFKQAQSWKGVLTKDDVNEWIAVDKLWNETFEKFYR